MQKARGQRWSLEELLDFESALAGWEGELPPERQAREHPREVFGRWMQGRESGAGRRWVAAVGVAGTVLCVLMAAGGFSAVWGMLDRTTSPAGLNVLWLLGVCLAGPWLLFVAGALAWLFRGRLPGRGVLGWLMRLLSSRALPKRMRDLGGKWGRRGELIRVLGWRLGSWTQIIAAGFHAGAVLGLGTMVLFKQVGFFWETTTRVAMLGFLERAVEFIALPWSWSWPGKMPDVPGSELGGDWASTGLGWWPFCLMALIVWGVIPRLLFAGWARWREERALAGLRLDAPAERKLYRALTQVQRGEEPQGPVDGALVVSLGAEPDREQLRPFLLQRLRLNPVGWETLGILDEGREKSAHEALAEAPAGIVITAEGWALAPRQLERVMGKIDRLAGERRLAVVVTGDVEPAARQEWEKFMDGRGNAGLWELWFAETHE